MVSCGLGPDEAHAAGMGPIGLAKTAISSGRGQTWVSKADFLETRNMMTKIYQKINITYRY